MRNDSPPFSLISRSAGPPSFLTPRFSQPIPAAEQARKFHLEKLAKVAKAEEDAQAVEEAKRAAMTISAKPIRNVTGPGIVCCFQAKPFYLSISIYIRGYEFYSYAILF